MVVDNLVEGRVVEEDSHKAAAAEVGTLGEDMPAPLTPTVMH